MAKKEATLILKIKQTGGKALTSIKSGLTSITGAAKTVAIGLGAVAAGITALVFKADEFKSVKKSFGALAASQGKDADKMLAKMRELSKGQISDLKLMQNANNALLLGLPVDKFGDMLTIARSASKATGESMEFMLKSITTGLGRGSKMILDNLGIMIDTNKAYEIFAQKVGKAASALTDAEKKQAFINEAMRIGLENADKLGEQNLTTAEAVNQLKIEMENLVPVLGDALRPVLNAVLPMVKEFGATLSNLARSDELHEWLNNGVAGFVLFKAVVKGVVGGLVQSFTGLATGIGQLLTGSFDSAIDSFKNLGNDITQPAKDAFNEAAVQIDAIDEKFAQNRRERRESERGSIAEDLQLKAEMKDEAEKEKGIQDEINKLAEQERKALHEDAMSELERTGQLKRLNQDILNAKTKEQKKAAVDAKAEAVEKAQDAERKRRLTAMAQFENLMNSEKVQGAKATLSQISTLQSAKSKELVLIGKSAAIAQITISTAEAAINAYKWGTLIGGPVGGAAFAGLAITAGAVQLANVAGVQLAEGGIVPSTPGGVQATIGEGGSDEAVIPLDDDDAQEKLGGGIGGGTTINVFGGMLGDENTAREFAVAVDAELLRLRQDNASTAFDEGVT